jgi:serine/threonine protein kinase
VARERFGDYALLERLGAGGMGEVFLARRSGQPPAVLKRVLPHLAQRPEFQERFLHEARVLARLSHPGVVQVLEIGDVAGQWFMVMEHVQGMSLQGLLADGALPAAAAVQVGLEAAAALQAAHGARDASGRPTPVVHRDVSPHNLLLAADGAVKLIDFGVASLTGVGATGGKLAYAAPEQLLEEVADARSDQYALGVVLWECLAGRPAFDAEEDAEVIRLVTEVGVGALPTSVPAGVIEVVRRMAALDPAQRYADLGAAGEALRATSRSLRLDGGRTALSERVRRRLVPRAVQEAVTAPLDLRALRGEGGGHLDAVERAALEALRGAGARFSAEEAERVLEAAALPGSPFALDLLQGLLEKGALVAEDEGGERWFRLA